MITPNSSYSSYNTNYLPNNDPRGAMCSSAQIEHESMFRSNLASYVHQANEFNQSVSSNVLTGQPWTTSDAESVFMTKGNIFHKSCDLNKFL